MHQFNRSIRISTRLLALGAMIALPSLVAPASACPEEELEGLLAAESRDAAMCGKKAIDAQANVFTSSTQENATLAVHETTGNVLVAWDSRRQEAGGYGVYARLFDAMGRALSPELHINQHILGMQRTPSVAFDAEGNAWFAWASSGQDGSVTGIVARRFNADFSEATNEIAVNDRRDGAQHAPVVATNAKDGSALVMWVTPADASSVRGETALRVRVFNADGTPRTDELAIEQPDGVRDHTASLTSLRNNRGYQVSWTRTAADGESAAIYAQRISSDGTPQGEPIKVSPCNNDEFHVESSIGVDANGQFVVAWMAESDERGYAVMARRFSCCGAPLDEEPIMVADADAINWKSGAAIAVAPDGRFTVSYNSFGEDGSYDGVFARAFNADGRATSERAYRVSDETEMRQYLTAATGVQRMAWSPVSESPVFAWNGNAGLGDSSAVNLTAFVADDVTEAKPAVLDTKFAAAQVSSDEYRTPIPPIWDPNFEPIEPLVSPAGDGPDFGFEAVQFTGWTPPDPEMAIGPDSIVVMTNGEISAYDKNGSQLWQDEIENTFGFWGNEGADNFVFDPEVLWDPHSNRYFAMACERSDNGRSNFLLAVSKDSRPETNSDWWKWRIDVTSISDNDIDSPNMAVDDGYCYLTADFFGPDKYLVYVLEKAPLLSGGALNSNHELIVGGSQQSMGIPVTYDAGAPAQYIIQSTELSNNTTVILHAVRDPLNNYSRTTFTLPVTAYQYPAQPPQRGTSSRPFLFEPRFWSCVYRNGSLWAVHHVNQTRTRARWYEIDMNGWPTSGQNPAVAQWGEIDPGSGIYTFFPSINVDDAGNAAITFARSATDEYISMSRTIRAASDTPGTFRPVEFVKESTAYTTAGRWGDYSFTQADPTSDGVFWGHHEFMLSTNNWRTWVARYDLEDRLNLVVTPLIAGQPATLSVDNASIGQRVYFGYSLAGPGQVYIPLLDVTLEIANPQQAGSKIADNTGYAEIRRNVPNGMSGRDVWMQAAQFQRISNVVMDTVQ